MTWSVNILTNCDKPDVNCDCELQHEGNEATGRCVYDNSWINPLNVEVTPHVIQTVECRLNGRGSWGIIPSLVLTCCTRLQRTCTAFEAPFAPISSACECDALTASPSRPRLLFLANVALANSTVLVSAVSGYLTCSVTPVTLSSVLQQTRHFNVILAAWGLINGPCSYKEGLI